MAVLDSGLRDRVTELRPIYLPPDRSSQTTYLAGTSRSATVCSPAIELPVGFGQTRRPTQLPVLVMVCGYSRWLSAALIPSRTAQDLFAGWWRLVEALGAVPPTRGWDGEGAIGRSRHKKIELTAETQVFRGTLGAKVWLRKPADPEAKGGDRAGEPVPDLLRPPASERPSAARAIGVCLRLLLGRRGDASIPLRT